MCNPVAVAVGTMAASKIMQGQAAQQQGAYANKVAKYNARVAENQATTTRNQGVEAENIHRQKVAQLVSQQRAAIGASGVAVDTGSPAGLLADTVVMGEADALRIRSNYDRSAQAQEQQAVLTRSQGRAKQQAGNTAFTASLLSAAGTAVGGMSAGSGSSYAGVGGEQGSMLQAQTADFGGAGETMTARTVSSKWYSYGGGL